MQVNQKTFLPHSMSIEYAESCTNLVGSQNHEQEHVNFSSKTCKIILSMLIDHKIHNHVHCNSTYQHAICIKDASLHHTRPKMHLTTLDLFNFESYALLHILMHYSNIPSSDIKCVTSAAGTLDFIALKNDLKEKSSLSTIARATGIPTIYGTCM